MKLISPLEVVQTVIDYYRSHEAEIELAQVEGFVRQIIGWREYMRAEFTERNAALCREKCPG